MKVRVTARAKGWALKLIGLELGRVIKSYGFRVNGYGLGKVFALGLRV